MAAAELAPGHPALKQGRKTLISVTCPRRGRVVLRDQEPLDQKKLRFAEGYTFDNLLKDLNARVFFWPGCEKGPIKRSGSAYFAKYRGPDILVLRVPTAVMLRQAGLAVTQYNSGATPQDPARTLPRGPDLFAQPAFVSFPPDKVVEVTFRSKTILPPETEVAPWTCGPFKTLGLGP